MPQIWPCQEIRGPSQVLQIVRSSLQPTTTTRNEPIFSHRVVRSKKRRSQKVNQTTRLRKKIRPISAHCSIFFNICQAAKILKQQQSGKYKVKQPCVRRSSSHCDAKKEFLEKRWCLKQASTKAKGKEDWNMKYELKLINYKVVTLKYKNVYYK